MGHHDLFEWADGRHALDCLSGGGPQAAQDHAQLVSAEVEEGITGGAGDQQQPVVLSYAEQVGTHSGLVATYAKERAGQNVQLEGLHPHAGEAGVREQDLRD